jgi:hypothetical protein
MHRRRQPHMQCPLFCPTARKPLFASSSAIEGLLEFSQLEYVEPPRVSRCFEWPRAPGFEEKYNRAPPPLMAQAVACGGA